MITDNEKYFKHLLLAESKKIFKDLFAKGPENVNIRITEDVIVMEFMGLLRKPELEIIQKNPDYLEVITGYRKALFECMNEYVRNRIESVLERKIIKEIYEFDLLNNSALWIMIFNSPL